MTIRLIFRLYLPLTPLLISESKGDRVDNPSFDLAHEMLAANIVYICFSLKLKPVELYPARSLLPNLQLIHTQCMTTAESLMNYMHAHLSSSDTRGELSNNDAAEIVNALVYRYKNLGRGADHHRNIHGGRVDHGSAVGGGESDWLLVENDTI